MNSKNHENEHKTGSMQKHPPCFCSSVAASYNEVQIIVATNDQFRLSADSGLKGFAEWYYFAGLLPLLVWLGSWRFPRTAGTGQP
jgi:hypothetical protein